MDGIIGAILLQAATTVQGVIANPPDASVAVISTSGGSIAAKLQHSLYALWGFDLTKPPPRWVLFISIFVFGVIGALLACMAIGWNPLDPKTWATACAVGLTGSAGDAAVTEKMQENREKAPEPTVEPPAPENTEPDLSGATQISLTPPPVPLVPSLVVPSQADLTSDADHQFLRGELWPFMTQFCTKYGFDPEVMLAICFQESGFKNWRVHFDGTGAGLFGLDDGGLLPDFERWAGMVVGRGQDHISIPPTLQIEYAAVAMGKYLKAYGDPYAVARAWHRGGGQMNDAQGQYYEERIRAHMGRLFG